MVKKLFKHEIFAYTRILIPVYAVLLGVALLGRFVQLFENDGFVYGSVFGSSVFVFVVSILGSFALTGVFGVIRFYRNLFTSEGYLSFTLPVTPAQHIFVKVLTATLAQTVTFIAVLLSVSIMTAGDVFVELLKAAGYLMGKLWEACGTNLPFYIIELILFVLISVVSEFLLFYTCIAIGQTFRKNRILASVGIYFAYYMISQVLSTILTIVVTILETVVSFEKIFTYIGEHILSFVHLFLCGGALFTGLFALLLFLITHLIIRKKLNLE